MQIGQGVCPWLVSLSRLTHWVKKVLSSAFQSCYRVITMLLSFICFNFKCGFKQKVKVNFQLGFFFFQLISYIKNLTMIKGSGLKFLVLYRGGKKKWERSRCRLPRLKINTLPSLRKLDGIAKRKSGESSLSRARLSSHKLMLIPDNER